MKEPVYDILIKNTRILTEDMKIRTGVDVAVKDGIIASICDSGSHVPAEADQTVDGSRLLWMPRPDRRSYAYLPAAAPGEDTGCTAYDMDPDYAPV